MGSVAISGNDFDVYSETSDPITDAKVYMSAKIGAGAWGDAEKLDQRQALVTATRWIERYLTAQLTDPATVPDPADTPAPIQVSEATYETAFVLIGTPTAQDQATTGSNKKRVKAGSAELEFFRPTDGTPFPTIAQQLLNEFLNIVGGTSDNGQVVFGTDGVSEFTDQDKFGRSRGFP